MDLKKIILYENCDSYVMRKSYTLQLILFKVSSLSLRYIRHVGNRKVVDNYGYEARG